ncbi:MAG: VanW family protein [Verrucomicrobiota bacterium]
MLGESVSPLRPAQSQAEVRLVAGKVHNLMMAAALLNGTVVPAGEIFSFWSVVGRPTRGRGFVEGRELREGCLVASVGGGPLPAFQRTAPRRARGRLHHRGAPRAFEGRARLDRRHRPRRHRLLELQGPAFPRQPALRAGKCA